MSITRVLVVDDHSVVRSGFRLLIDAQVDMEVVGEAGSGLEALEAVKKLRPHVLLMDVRMPGMDGIEACKRLTAMTLHPAPRVVILTTYDLDEYVMDALRAGACGFLIKHVPAEEVVAAIRAAARGDAMLSPSVTKRLIAEFARQRPPAAKEMARLNDLTEREREVLLLVARGLSNLEIASQLGVGEGTVKTHVSRMLDKLGVRDRVQAVILAYETGAVQPGYR